MTSKQERCAEALAIERQHGADAPCWRARNPFRHGYFGS